MTKKFADSRDYSFSMFPLIKDSVWKSYEPSYLGHLYRIFLNVKGNEVKVVRDGIIKEGRLKIIFYVIHLHC